MSRSAPSSHGRTRLKRRLIQLLKKLRLVEVNLLGENARLRTLSGALANVERRPPSPTGLYWAEAKPRTANESRNESLKNLVSVRETRFFTKQVRTDETDRLASAPFGSWRVVRGSPKMLPGRLCLNPMTLPGGSYNESSFLKLLI